MFEVTKIPGAVRYRYVVDGSPAAAPPPAPKQPAAKRVADLPAADYQRSRARLLAGDPNWHVPESFPTGHVNNMSDAEYERHKAALLAAGDRPTIIKSGV
jgi:hypothetical protein